MARLKTEKVLVTDLIEYENNPRRNDKAVSAVMESIRKFGYVNPIIVNHDNVILAGHTRLKALRQTGDEEVEVIRLSHLTEQEEKAFRMADNRASDFSTWDTDLLESEMKEIGADDWEKFGFSNKILSKLTEPNMCTCPKCGASFIRV